MKINRGVLVRGGWVKLFMCSYHINVNSLLNSLMLYNFFQRLHLFFYVFITYCYNLKFRNVVIQLLPQFCDLLTLLVDIQNV